MKTIRYTSLIFTLLALTFSALWTTPVRAAPNAAPDWTISGTIYGGSNPLPGAVINLNDAGTSNLVGTATTNGSGFYSIAVSDGTYNMTIAPPSGSGFSNSVVNGIVVSGGNVTQNVVLVQRAFTLSGVVKTSGGVLLDRVYVRLYDQASGTQIGNDYYTTTNGQYSFSVAPGTYKIVVQSSGSTTLNTPSYWQISPIVSNLAVSGNTTQDLVIPFVTLSGKTTDGNGVAVAGVELRTNKQWNANGVSYDVRYYPGRAVSDPSGNYAMNLFPYTYNVTILPPTASGLAQTMFNNVAVTGDTTRDFAAAAAVTLSGVVKTSGGVLLDRVYVRLYDQASGTQIGNDYYTTTNGQYSFSVASGTYKIVVQSSGSTTLNTPSSWYISPIVSNLAVNGNTTQDLVIPFVTLSGKTTDGNGVAVGGVVLRTNKYWGDANGISYHIQYDGGWAISDPSGNYAMNLLPYTYDVTILPPTASGLAQTMFNNVTVIGDTTRDFAANAAVTLSGVVKTSGGVLLDKVYVQLYDQVSGTQIGNHYYTTTNGQYSFSAAPGTYKIVVQSSGSTTLNTPSYWYISPIVSNLAISGNTTQDLVIPFVTLSGKTTDANGVAVGGVVLRVNTGWSANGIYYAVRYEGDRAISDSSGNYAMNLFPYTYNETILPPDQSGFAQTQVNGIPVTTPILQNIILAMPDAQAPTILSGPMVTNITSTSALVQWQTSEPAQGGVRYGASNPPGTTQSESGYVVTHSQALTGLSADTLYYVSVFATDEDGNGPVSSGVISFRTMALTDTTPPFIIEGPTITTITHTSATVTWQTNEPATGVVSYGLAPAFGQTVPANTLATSHSLTLSGLTPETLYYLKVSATDAASNGPTDSATLNFWTLAAPDTTAPVIVEGPMAINISATGATIVWRTDEPATSGVSLNDGTVYKVYSDDTLTAFHSVQATGLSPSTTYTYVVSSKDAFGNGPTLSTPRTFTTLAAPDTDLPVITEGPLVANVTHQSAIIRWKTDEPTDALIEYGTTPAFGLSEARTALVTHHNIPLTGLASGTLYYFRISSKDAAGNGPTVSATYTFTTDSQHSNKTPVITAGPQIIYSSNNIATVSFETDIPCDTVVEYGQGGALINRQSNGEKVNAHQITLTNLEPNTAYGVTVSCTDMAGNTVVAQAGEPVFRLAFHPAGIVSDFPLNLPALAGFTTESLPDTTSPVITGDPVVTPISPTQSMITWTTNEIADSQVNYHVSGQTLNRTAGDIVQGFTHSVVLTNLTPSAEYQFTVTSYDPSGNQVTSAVISFTNNVTDQTAPVVTAFSAVSPSTSINIAIPVFSASDNMAVTGYLITESSTPPAANDIGWTGAAPTVYTVPAGGSYTLYPWAKDAAGNVSALFGSPVSVVVDIAVTPTPTPTVTATNAAPFTATPTITRTPTKTATKIATPITITLTSIAAQDGWILESSEHSGKGGAMEGSIAAFNLGDNSAKYQYLGILSFSTGASLPDNAVITKVMLKVKQKSVTGGGNPVAIFQGFMVDIKNGFFGSASALQIGDFQALASKSYGPFKPAPVSSWYTIDLTGAKPFVNKLAANAGLTQIRLRFKLDDSDNAFANYISLYSGSAPAGSQPQLVITYYVP